MATFKKAFEQMQGIEFSSVKDILHKNEKEKGLTFFGIYETAHEQWEGWEYVYLMIKKHHGDLKQASMACFENDHLMESVETFYYEKFWLPLKLNMIESQKIADEMFFFYVNTGNKKKTIKMAQLVVGAVPDGFIGIETITKLNSFDETVFDRAYDLHEMEYHARLVQANPSLYLLNLVGWIRRDVRV